MYTAQEQAFIDAATNCADSIFKAKFVDLPGYIKDWASRIGGLEGKRVLDFGCGNGTTACAVALTQRPALVVGIDIHRQFEGCLAAVSPHVPIASLPANLAFEQVKPGDLGSVNDYDLIYAWSVFEHIDQHIFDDLVKGLRGKLRNGGCLFMQVAPLYYSAEGAHLTLYGIRQWEHLTQQINEIRRRVFVHPTMSEPDKERDWNCFVTLNRLTAPEMIKRICRQGFTLIKDYYTRDAMMPPDEVLSVYNGSVVTTKQIAALFQRVD